MKTVKFVAYTTEGQESSGGMLINHVIAPVDVSAIPAEVRNAYPGNRTMQIIHTVVEPEFLITILGTFDTYPEAAAALANAHYWRKTSSLAD